MEFEDFGKKLFTILSQKLILEKNRETSEKNPDSADEKRDFLEENLKYSDPNDDVSRSVLMLSYACRPAFTDRFEKASEILMSAKEIPPIYVRTFEEVVLEKYSPLKLLMLCSFISEIFLFTSVRLVFKKKHHYYLQQTTKALNDAFRRIFKQGFPQNGWTDIQNEASKIAKGFKFLEPFLNTATVCQVARSILSEKEQQQTDIIMAESPSQQMVHVNISHCELSEPSSQVLVDIPVTDAPVNLPADGLPTSETAYLDQNMVCTRVFPISFGSIDEVSELSYLLNISSDQDEVVMFENKPSGMKPDVSFTVKTAESANTASQAKENLSARNPENEQEPVFQTIKRS